MLGDESIKEFIPIIKVKFRMSGDSFDTDLVTNKLKVKPTRIKLKNSFPAQSIALGLAATIWEYEIVENNCKAISVPFDKMVHLLYDKASIINEIAKELNLEIDLVIVIHAYTMSIPEMMLSLENISYAHSINARVSFDLYCYDGEP